MFIENEQRGGLKMECNNVKMLRVKFNKTQQQMADIIKVSTATYIRKEQGKIKFTLTEVKIYKECFDLTLQEVWDIFFNFEVHFKLTKTV